MGSTRHTQSTPEILRKVPLLMLLWAPIGLAASCGSGGSTGDMFGEQSLPQTTCGGTFSVGGSGIGGSLKGGTGGSGGCPNDDCTTFTCSRAGTCTPGTIDPPGTICVAPEGKGHCGGVDIDGDRRYDFTHCCVEGCLSRDLCVTFSEQSDGLCGRVGAECIDCGECKTCNGSGSCVATSGACTGGQCMNGSCCTGCISGAMCIVDSATACGSNGGTCISCDDNRACTDDRCSGGSCTHTPITGACNDMDECTVNDQCSGSTCSGTPKVCNDGNECTMDSCDSATGCRATPVAGSCNDGNACTNPDSCSNGNCTGTMINCDDGNQCTDDSCNPMMGCVHTSKAEGATCNDGNDCSTGDRCHDDDTNPNTPRVCEPTTGPNCEDGNPCTSDIADCSTGACPHGPVNNGSPCSTGTLCSVGQTCQAGVCQGGTTINCNDDNPCTADACDAAAGCTHTPGNNGNACNDGNPCTTDDACDAGDCVGEPVECVAIDECHDIGECDSDTGTCDDPRKPNGTECGRTGTCQSGRCEGDGVVEPTGGTGPGTAGGGPGGGDTGGTGTAGDGAGDTGGTSNGGASGNGAASGNESGGTKYEDTPLYERNPGGCACRLTASGPARGDYAALTLAAVLAFVTRRRRRAA